MFDFGLGSTWLEAGGAHGGRIAQRPAVLNRLPLQALIERCQADQHIDDPRKGAHLSEQGGHKIEVCGAYQSPVQPADDREDRGRGVEPVVAVYVPTNHLYLGDIVLFPRDRAFFPDVTVEEGIRIFLTGGMSLPGRIAPKR